MGEGGGEGEGVPLAADLELGERAAPGEDAAALGHLGGLGEVRLDGLVGGIAELLKLEESSLGVGRDKVRGLGQGIRHGGGLEGEGNKAGAHLEDGNGELTGTVYEG